MDLDAKFRIAWLFCQRHWWFVQFLIKDMLMWVTPTFVMICELGNARQYLFIWNFALGNHHLLAPTFGTLSTLHFGSGIFSWPSKTKRQLNVSFSEHIPVRRTYLGSGWNFQGQLTSTYYMGWFENRVPIRLAMTCAYPTFRQIQTVSSEWQD